MTTSKGILRTKLFYIDHLDPESDTDRIDIKGFTIEAPEGQGLSIYLKECARDDELSGDMRTYLVRDNITDDVQYNEHRPFVVITEPSGKELRRTPLSINLC